MERGRKRQVLLRIAALLALLGPLWLGGGLPVPEGGGAVQAQVALTNTIRLRVLSARTEPDAPNGPVNEGDEIATYKFMINKDNTGDPFGTDHADCDPFQRDADGNVVIDTTTGKPVRNLAYPGECDLPSIRTVPAWAPIYYQGTQDNLSTGTTLELPDGKYLISVTSDGFKLDGEHFTIPAADTDGDGVADVTVRMHPLPLPPASMVILVFEDNAMTNGQFDTPSEHGLAGFRASLNDILGEITTDLFGNPLCTTYEYEGGNVKLDADGAPVILELGAGCFSDENGYITIPNIGPLRYDVLVLPPAGTDWIQTTTLEGSHGWDTWLQEGGTGLDNEFLIAPEPFPWTIFGFVKPTGAAPNLGGTGTIQGVIMGAATFIPAQNGLPFQGRIFGGFAGTKNHRHIANPWLSLNDLQTGDVAVWVGQGNPNGTFEIPSVPPGNYLLTYWDENQHYILDFVQVTVRDGEVTDVGVRHLTNWFTESYGTVFHDINENGRQDPGEPGVPNYLVVLKDRDNTEIDRMSIASMTDASGFWELPKGYPMGSWMILEAYSDLYRTTGITYQTLNMPEEKTILGGIVDIGLLPILGQPVRLDWGVVPYGENENGGIGGTVFYDTVRAEDDARYAGVEPWQPGIPGLEVRLYKALMKGDGTPVINPDDGSYMKANPDGKAPADGAEAVPIGVTTTETYERPTGCQPLDVDGVPVDFPPVPPADPPKPCMEGILMGTQIGNGQNPLDGNWGFSDWCPEGGLVDPVTGMCPNGLQPEPLPAGDYLVEVVIPNDESGNPMFQVTREEDLNVFDGDTFVPEVPPPACAGPLHIVNVKDADPDQYDLTVDWFGTLVTLSSGPEDAVVNPNYAAEYANGFLRYEGQAMPLCNVKHIQLTNGKAIAPAFNLFTEVPIPGKWRGYIIDDLNVSVDPNTLFFGEMAGVPEVPIGLYDFAGNLVHTVHSDFNGVYEVLMPSTGTYNAPTPSGMFANVYYQYGNDPGPIGAPNEHYNPQYRSIGTSFEIYPGVTVPADLAPTQNGATVFSPTSQFDNLAQCKTTILGEPQFFAVAKPYGTPGEWIAVLGANLGASGTVRLGSSTATTQNWSGTGFEFRIPNGMSGPQQLRITTADGKTVVNAITIHVMTPNYRPTVYTVGAGDAYDFDASQYDTASATAQGGAIQAAIDQAYADGGRALVVVYPGPLLNQLNTPVHVENPVIYAPVKLQGVGPGGILPDGNGGTIGVPGTVIDGRGVGGDSPYTDWWRAHVADIWTNRGGWGQAYADENGDPLVYEGAVVTVYAEPGEFGSAYRTAIDGLLIQGGDQQGFPGNRETIGGAPIPGVQPNVVVQGGGIYVHAHADYLQITNNVIQSNGGAYGGAIRLGTPNVPAPDNDNHNDNVLMAHNTIRANGSTNLAGAIGVFNGADSYEIRDSDICGNATIEYGGGISHYGYSPNGSIHHNRIYFNSAYDEGGGVMIAGELPAVPGTLSPGAGPVNVYNNLIYSNLSNDDGGGLRFLMAGNYVYNVYNNMIVGNVSTHEGGGISLNDAPRVRVFNNTVMNNVTTATAMTSDGSAAPAGLSSSRNSSPLQATLPASSPIWSDPLLFNNILWGNRAGFRFGIGVSGIGQDGDPLGFNYWDLGVADGSGVLSPMYSLLQVSEGDPSTNLIGMDPAVVEAIDTQVSLFPWRGNPNFVGAHIVVLNLAPISEMGDYHLTAASPAINAGAASVGTGQNRVTAPAFDYDHQARPSPAGNNNYDIGADELSTGPVIRTFVPEERTYRVVLPMIRLGGQ